MKYKVKRYVGAFFLILIIGGAITAKPCFAASAEVEISSETEAVIVGDNVFIHITIHSETLFGDFEANLTYDDDILEYQDGASVITGSSGFLKISDMGMAKESSTRKYTLKFEAKKVGMSEISFRGRAIVYDYDSGLEMSVSSNVFTLEVKSTETASNNANLKSFKINPSELVPKFDKNVFEYKVNVGNETEKLIINALPEDENATVTISGNDFLKEGENKVIVTVLAESGAVIEYNVNVNREYAPDEENTTDDPIITPEESLRVFEVVDIEGEFFVIYSGKYKLLEPSSEVMLPKGYSKTKIMISDIAITAYSPEKDLENEFYLIYARNESGEEGFYQYDRIEKTLQRYEKVNDSGLSDTVAADQDEIIQSKEYRANLGKAAIVIAFLSALCALLVVVLVCLLLKSKGFKKKSKTKTKVKK